jgi:hypothetical protein
METGDVGENRQATLNMTWTHTFRHITAETPEIG